MSEIINLRLTEVYRRSNAAAKANYTYVWLIFAYL